MSVAEYRARRTEEFKAALIAKQAHEGQTDKAGRPYEEHLARVSALACDLDLEDVTLCKVRAVGWLHDIFEDTTWTPEMLRAEGISEEVIEAVQLLTRPKNLSYGSYIQFIKNSGNQLAFTVKIADLRDHLRPTCPPNLRTKYILALMALHDVTFAELKSETGHYW